MRGEEEIRTELRRAEDVTDLHYHYYLERNTTFGDIFALALEWVLNDKGEK